MTKNLFDHDLSLIKITYNQVKQELRIYCGAIIEIYKYIHPKEVEGIENWTLEDVQWFKKYNERYNLKIKL